MQEILPQYCNRRFLDYGAVFIALCGSRRKLAGAVRTSARCRIHGRPTVLTGLRRRVGSKKQLRQPPRNDPDDQEIQECREKVTHPELEWPNIPRRRLPVTAGAEHG